MTLADIFKAQEKAFETTLPSNSYIVVRLDGKAFHTFTKQFARPYDLKFMEAMDDVAAVLCKAVSGSILGYVQSDEISIIFGDVYKEATQQWLGGRVEKIVSVAAATATGAFMQTLPTKSVPVFDARVHTLSGPEEIVDYLMWRRRDAYKNAITMAAGVHYSHKFLDSKNTTERLALLEDTEHAVLPDGFLNGRILTRKSEMRTVQYTHKKTQEAQTVEAMRTVWDKTPATIDTIKALLSSL